MINSTYQPKIMGIVNVTPDSFSDGGDFFDTKKAIDHGLQLEAEGADVLDIGGESTRPGAESISIDEELARVIPVIEGVRQGTDCEISVDTRHASVMNAAVAAGATMINDVYALQGEAVLATASVLQVPVCLMHMQGEPDTMQKDPQYEDVTKEVYDFLHGRITACEAAGIKPDAMYVDVGIGFGKSLEHNLALLHNLDQFAALGVKTLLGTSRKRFIEKVVGKEVVAKDRLPGSLASLAAGLDARVDMFRVHDVAATKQFIAVYTAINS